ncbi:MAG: phosphoenolpyruvate carboxykinase [Nitrospirae bacterium]|nr:phosphoenolpyruvate carboxykinase [Nitrospirota bacterium]
MTVKIRPYVITRGKVVFDYSAMYCDTPESVLKSPLFEEIVRRFVERIGRKGSTLFAFLTETLPWTERQAIASEVIKLFRFLFSYSAEEVAQMNAEYREILSDKEALNEVVEELYNYWRRYERFFYLEAPRRSRYSKSSIHHAQFIKANEELKNLVLYVYRRISEHITGDNPRVYRQLPAGANMGMLTEQIDWDCPEPYRALMNIPFIRLTLMEPPLILYPEMNKRKGKFEEVEVLPPGIFEMDRREWFCFPARVGDLTAFIYFHQDFISLGLSLSNLFEIADYEEIESKRPEIILIFGVKARLPGRTLFFDDRENNMMVGLVEHHSDVDYFGYFKKMTLTLHNITMIKRGRMPIHGAMVLLKLKSGERANIVIVGDSGAGKSETLEAFRTLAEEHICEMRIIFDDMGSLGLDRAGRVVGYGTEIGAFVRLDDLQPGYAYEEIDRSIFMNPDKTNARLIMPVTRYHHVVKGYPVDYMLYANNYEEVDPEHPGVEFFDSVEEALHVFRNGARLAKGTTDEKGLVHTYFANPFGAPQRRDDHERLAREYFQRMYEQGIRIGQIRTRLGIEGYEQLGPQSAALELFRVLKDS